MMNSVNAMTKTTFGASFDRCHGGARSLWMRRLVATTLISGSALLSPWQAEASNIATDTASGVEVAQSSMVTVDIPAQSLDRALTSLADQANLKLFFPSEGLGGLEASELQGEMPVDAALTTLLRGSGYTWRYTDGGTVTIEKLSANGEGVLDTIHVQASALVADPTSPVEGYIATTTNTATKTGTSIVEAPQSISVVTRDEMTDRGAATLFEATRYTAGVFGEAYGKDPRGYDSFYMRGFTNYETGEFRDGLRVSGGNQALYAAEAYGLERVDILKGSSNTLYGQANVGGIVNSTTKRPHPDQKQEVRLEYGDWNHVSGAFDIGGAMIEDQSAMFRLVGLASHGNYEYDLANGDEVDKDRLYIAPSFLLQPNDDTKLTIMTDYTRDERGGNYVFVDAQGNNVGFMPGEPGFEYYNNDQFTAGIELDHRINDTWQVRQKTRYSSLDVEAGGVFGWRRNGNNIDRYVNYTDNEVRGVVVDNQVQADLEVGEVEHTILMGVDGEYEINELRYGGEDYTVSSLNISNPVYAGTNAFTGTFKSEYDFDQTNIEYGFYAQDQMRLNDHWLVSLGGRYSNAYRKMEYNQTGVVSENTEDAFTGQAAISYEFENGLVPYVSYSQGFNINNNVDVNGQTFDPEESDQYELGLKYQPAQMDALFTASLFQLTKTNVVTYDSAALAYVQSEEVRSRGLELEAKVAATDALDLVASYAFTKAEITESEKGNSGNYAPYAPKHMASLWAKYSFDQGALNGLSIGSGVRYNGGYYSDEANLYRADSFALFDASLNYQIDPNWALGVNATNLFDDQYITNCSQYRCYIGDGRRVIANLTYNW
ncbi:MULTISPECIES: TonB-dependent siderophore receptor [unclassified Thalassospira]|uniref:TonB-dependent siderophore receptor n=1 Tax=unclassified Thalassospira TaxID=2648997 RepID=UPI0007A5D73B|nr:MULTISPECIES: TonB-dependent siderophore receptor [unclassified Thalassospira]